MENKLCDFLFDTPETDEDILASLQSKGKLRDYLKPSSFTKHKLIHIQPFSYNPYTQSKQEDLEIESKAIKSISIPYEEQVIPSQPLCKATSKTVYFELIKNYFNERPIYLKNVLIQHLPKDHNISKNHLKHLLAYFTYSFESGPWRNTYVRLDYNPKLDPRSVIYQVIDFRTKEDLWSARGPYDYTFSTLPTQQGQLYQLCDIESEFIKDILINPDSLAPDCSKKTGWLSKKSFQDIREEIKSIYLKLKLE